MEENDEFLSDSQTERFILSIEEQYKQSHTLNMYPSYILAWQHHPFCSLFLEAPQLLVCQAKQIPFSTTARSILMLISFINEETVSIE